jgi:riboflavin synthase
MFTGIIEEKGKVAAISDQGRSLVVAATVLADAPIGSSVTVNGVCLTTVETTDLGGRFDVVPETLARTNLGSLGVGDEVNLERAMAADGRFDGHIVQGHVDDTGTVVDLETGPDGVVLTVAPPEHLMSQIVEKGSITIDGASLTISSVTPTTFAVALIPHTLELTTLGSLDKGDTVNLETDVIAKYVHRLVGTAE